MFYLGRRWLGGGGEERFGSDGESVGRSRTCEIQADNIEKRARIYSTRDEIKRRTAKKMRLRRQKFQKKTQGYVDSNRMGQTFQSRCTAAKELSPEQIQRK
eukprot:720888-Pleurochrysis_carterae.AAC.1